MFKQLDFKIIGTIAFIAILLIAGTIIYSQWSYKQFVLEIGEAPQPTTSTSTETETPIKQTKTTQPVNKNIETKPKPIDAPVTDSAAEKQENPSEPKQNQQAPTTESEEKEKLLYGDYTEKELAEIKNGVSDLRDRLLEKYPEFKDLTDMTQERIEAKYPTLAEQKQLAEKASKFAIEYFEEVAAFMKVIPPTVRSDMLERVHAELKSSWGQAAADASIIYIGTLME